MAMEALRSAIRFTVGFLAIVGVSAVLTMAVDHVAVQARNNEKTVASPAPSVQTSAPDALEAPSAHAVSNGTAAAADASR